ncbi:MAG: hypothetical protein HPY78_03320 [Brevinematales bacterium]|nr:hypothetical protein [Brevinematales bacterium]
MQYYYAVLKDNKVVGVRLKDYDYVEYDEVKITEEEYNEYLEELNLN